MTPDEIATLLLKVRKDLDFLSKRLEVAAQDILLNAEQNKSRKATKRKKR
jgi:hypothetical protein